MADLRLYPLLVIASVGLPAHCANAQTIDDMVRAFAANHDKFLSIPCLTTRFTLEYVKLKGKRQFAFDTVDVKTYRKGSKLRASSIGRRSGKVVMMRDCAWDGEAGTEYRSTEGHGQFILTRGPSDLIFYYNYYVDFIYFPEARGSFPPLKKAGVEYPDRTWLPPTLSDHALDYSIRETDTTQPPGCVLIEREGLDKLWLDPIRSFALRKREMFRGPTLPPAERTTLSQYEELEGAHMPKLVVREEFGGADDPTSVEGQVRCTKTIIVEEFSTGEIPDAAFRLTPQPGVEVHDTVLGRSYTYFTDQKNPVISAAEAARRTVSASDPTGVLAYVAAAGAIVLACGLAVAMRLQSRRSKKRRPPG